MQQNSQQSVHEFNDPILETEGQRIQDETPLQQQTNDDESLDHRQRKSSQIRSIKIKVEQCKKSQKNEQLAKQCRICLQGEEEGRMIRPCLCSGSISFVHEKCIMQWIKRKHEQKNIKPKPTCQMCNTPFHYKFGKRRMLSSQQFCQNYQKQRCNFLLFYTLATFLLLVITGLIVIVTVSQKETEIGRIIKNTLVKNQNVKIIYICVVFILAIVLMFLLILFTIQYAVKSEVVISEVRSYSQSGTNKKCRIFPKNAGKKIKRDYSISTY